jgi:hypothetical protein
MAATVPDTAGADADVPAKRLTPLPFFATTQKARARASRGSRRSRRSRRPGRAPSERPRTGSLLVVEPGLARGGLRVDRADRDRRRDAGGRRQSVGGCVVARSDDDHHSRRDRGVESGRVVGHVGVAVPVIERVFEGAAERQVDHADVVLGAVIDRPVDPRQDVGVIRRVRARTVRCVRRGEDLDRDDLRGGRPLRRCSRRSTRRKCRGRRKSIGSLSLSAVSVPATTFEFGNPPPPITSTP